MISGSQKSSIESRASTTVTFEPSAANIDANSMPITPAPTIRIVDGRLARRRTMSSESRTVLPLNSISGGCAGSEPVAITTCRAEMVRTVSSRPSTARVCSSTKRAQPSSTVTRLRNS